MTFEKFRSGCNLAIRADNFGDEHVLTVGAMVKFFTEMSMCIWCLDGKILSDCGSNYFFYKFI